MTLRQKIEQEIHDVGPMPFWRYMELCLYEPELGYYSRYREQFGKTGDFYTSSDVHAVFGRLLSRQFNEIWEALGSPEQLYVVELGPGRGLFAQDVLEWSKKKFPEFARALRYGLVERSASLRGRLQIRFAEQIASGAVQVCAEWEPESSAPVIVFANEFFDALPVEVVSPKGSLHIQLAEDGRLEEIFLPLSSEIQEFLDRYGVPPENHERVEASLECMRYARDIAEKIRTGVFIAIDYGYTRDELFAGRHRGTVAAFRQHTLSMNPYEAPGEQDITAHVNFTALQAAAEQGGLSNLALLTQAQFLMGIGEQNQFSDAFEECCLPQERAKVALQLKHLVTPAGMGENFHVLIMGKGIELQDVKQLSGMSFAALLESNARKI